MANPKELQEAADAIPDVRRLPAVQRHKQLESLLQQAEEWARKEYRKVSEKNGDRNAASATDPIHPTSSESLIASCREASRHGWLYV